MRVWRGARPHAVGDALFAWGFECAASAEGARRGIRDPQVFPLPRVPELG